MNSLVNRDILSIGDLSKDEIQSILAQAAEFEQRLARGERHNVAQLLRDYILATVFYEPSTRTRLSFESAMTRLGGRVISVAEAQDVVPAPPRVRRSTTRAACWNRTQTSSPSATRPPARRAPWPMPPRSP